MMKKVFYGKIGGKFYPMVFSLGAKKQLKEIKKVIAPFMEFSKINIEELNDDQKLELLSEMVDYISVTAEILISQGVAYKNRFESTFRTRPNDAVDERGVWCRISAQDIMLILEDDEIKPLNDAIIKCLTSENGSIQTQPNPKTSKKKRA